MLKIKEIRESKNLTQDDIVSLTGIKKRTYVDYENEKSEITVVKLQLIASALEVNISDLISGAESKIETNLDYKERYIELFDENRRLYIENKKLIESINSSKEYSFDSPKLGRVAESDNSGLVKQKSQLRDDSE